jgi:hypothetical protein
MLYYCTIKSSIVLIHGEVAQRKRNKDTTNEAQ